MSQELLDFEYFKKHQLHVYEPTTAVLDTIQKNGRIYKNVGSINSDGYVRMWCNRKLRMKHRLIYFLEYGKLPKKGEEIDHIDNIRNNNCINNLRILSKKENNTKSFNRKFGKQLSLEKIHIICKLLQDTDISDKLIAEKIGRSRGTVRDIKTRRTRTKISSKYSWPHRGW
jgi:hypothetical protein